VSIDADVGLERGGFRLDARLSVDRGRTVALLGPNGAGKSTLVAVLAGLLPPERGRVSLDGTVLDDAVDGVHVPPHRRPIGVLFQDLRLLPHLSALENVAFPLRARGEARRAARASAGEWLERVGAGERAAARPTELSGGEAQRVALARALVAAPHLLLLDEPLSSVDAEARPELRSLLRDTLAGFSGVAVLVTHDPVEAMSLADRLVLMERGRVTQAGTPEEIQAAPRTSYAAELVGLNRFAGRLERQADGSGLLQTPHGSVVVTWPAAIEGPTEDVLGLVLPTDVALHLARPEGSMRNLLEGRIVSMTVERDRARVRLASSPPVMAEVTAGSAVRLGLAEGLTVWASFKAVEVTLVLP
jgi:molybdate transport system ATP-binding protein